MVSKAALKSTDGIPAYSALSSALGRPPSTTKATIRASTDEPADLALYLGSAESDGMTRQTLLLDGGMLME